MNIIRAIVDPIVKELSVLKPSEAKKRKYEAIKVLLLLMAISLGIIFAITNFVFAFPIASIFLVAAISALIPSIIMMDFVMNKVNSLSDSLFQNHLPFITGTDLNEEIEQIVDGQGKIIKTIKMKDFLREITDFSTKDDKGISKQFRNFLLDDKNENKNYEEKVKEFLDQFLNKKFNFFDSKIYPNKSFNQEKEQKKKNDKNKKEIIYKITKYTKFYLQKAGKAKFEEKDFTTQKEGGKAPLTKFIEKSIKNEQIKIRFFTSSLLTLPVIGLWVAFAPVIVGASIATGPHLAIFGLVALCVIALFQLGAKRIQDKTNEIPSKIDLKSIEDVKVGKKLDVPE